MYFVMKLSEDDDTYKQLLRTYRTTTADVYVYQLRAVRLAVDVGADLVVINCLN